MNNKDLPAHPFEYGACTYTGLTKLEYAAIHIAAGLYANGDYAGVEDCAVTKAKALFDELEKG